MTRYNAPCRWKFLNSRFADFRYYISECGKVNIKELTEYCPYCGHRVEVQK